MSTLGHVVTKARVLLFFLAIAEYSGEEFLLIENSVL